jgi:hypothetical protein
MTETNLSNAPIVVTYDNNPNEYTKRFISTLEANRWEYVVIGKGDEWKGFLTRVVAYEAFLKTLPAEKLVILSDARDVLCIRSPHAFVDAFRSFKKDLVVSMELLCNGKFSVDDSYKSQVCVPLKNYWKHYNITSMPARKFVNAGLVAGTVSALLHVLQYVQKYMVVNNTTNDQSAFGNYINEFPERVACDVEASLLHTSVFGVNAGIQSIHLQKEDSPTFAELFGRGAFFLHIPGMTAKGQKVVYEQVCNVIDLGITDTQLRKPYGYAEPAWNEIF